MKQTAAEYALRENQPLRLDDAGGRLVECLSGVAWITAYGQHTDFLLRPGQSFLVPNDGLTLVEAIIECRVRVSAPASAGWLQHAARYGQARLGETMDRLRQSLQPAA
ncbi:DUF2917 domain-containing protein [Pseudoduganella violacea]|uniref:DUF2917 domain-containing protein n=1 Tax=Pseudoduganella violacea TaxID=1715466 RepID=A0A7W5B936_9BURK|nr:DUF2917 domain-containing protein [Pseudoduganella violacea]MBB3118480.1 hypothetical protein [Pseudoduganella violacea]